MFFVLQTPSLQHLAGVKIVIHLWTQRDIFTQIAQSFNSTPVHEIKQETNEWKVIEEKVQSKLLSLPLPIQFKNQILNFVKPLGTELIAWCKYHGEEEINFQFLDDFSPHQLCWTMHGTIDYAKTAELMLKDERFDVERRYEIACVNCLEEEARVLLESMADNQRRKYINKITNIRHIDHRYLIAFFTCTLSGDVAHLHEKFQAMMSRNRSFHKFLFEVMLRRGNRATVEYLFKKLNPQEKEQLFEECKRHMFNPAQAHSIGSVLYLLWLMNEDQLQRHMLEQYTYGLLLCLLRFPMQSLFMEAAECGWGFIDKDACAVVLKGIIDKIRLGLQDYDYAQLFWKCWRLSPAEYQHLILSNHRLLGDLLLTKRKECIELVLNEGSLIFLENVVDRNDYRLVLMDESGISDVALMAVKEAAALNSSNEPENEDKRMRSELVSRLINMVMEWRMKRKRL